MKKTNVLLLLIVIMMTVSLPVTASTDTSEICEKKLVLSEGKYSHINTIDGLFSIDRTGKANYAATATSYDTVSKTAIYVFIKRKENGSWNTYKMYSTSEEGRVAKISGSCQVPSGYEYKMVEYVYLYDKNGNLLESASDETNPIKY